MKLSISHLLSPGLPGWTSCLETGVIKICICCCNSRVLGCHYSEDVLCRFICPPPSTLFCSKRSCSDIPCGVFLRVSLVVPGTDRGARDVTWNSWDVTAGCACAVCCTDGCHTPVALQSPLARFRPPSPVL